MEAAGKALARRTEIASEACETQIALPYQASIEAHSRSCEGTDAAWSGRSAGLAVSDEWTRPLVTPPPTRFRTGSDRLLSFKFD